MPSLKLTALDGGPLGPFFIPSLARAAVASWALSSMVVLLPAQTKATGDDASRRGKRAATDEGATPRRSFEDIQQRMLTGLRDRLNITNEEEWSVISPLVLKVTELRRSSMATGATWGGGGGLGAGGGGGGAGGARRTGRGGGGNLEVESLQSAVKDQMPDAEIKARLSRMREVRKANALKLEKAQEDLRAVLTVRQEAIAVLAGLLP